MRMPHRSHVATHAGALARTLCVLSAEGIFEPRVAFRKIEATQVELAEHRDQPRGRMSLASGCLHLLQQMFVSSDFAIHR
jgi:hypothetical protein